MILVIKVIDGCVKRLKIVIPNPRAAEENTETVIVN